MNSNPVRGLRQNKLGLRLLVVMNALTAGVAAKATPNAGQVELCLNLAQTASVARLFVQAKNLALNKSKIIPGTKGILATPEEGDLLRQHFYELAEIAQMISAILSLNGTPIRKTMIGDFGVLINRSWDKNKIETLINGDSLAPEKKESAWGYQILVETQKWSNKKDSAEKRIYLTQTETLCLMKKATLALLEPELPNGMCDKKSETWAETKLFKLLKGYRVSTTHPILNEESGLANLTRSYKSEITATSSDLNQNLSIEDFKAKLLSKVLSILKSEGKPLADCP